MSIEQFNQTPFRDSLIKTEYDSRMVEIKKLKNRPDKLIREHELEEGEDKDELIELHSESKKLFEKINNDYGINVISQDHIVGKNENGKIAIFTIVDKIVGKNLSETEKLPDEMKNELDALYESLGQHCINAWKQNSKYWADVNNRQFIYGHKYGEKEKHIYLADVDPRFFRPNENELFSIEWVIHNICESLAETEKKFESRIHLEKARTKLLNIVSEMQDKIPNNKWLLKAKNKI